MIARASGLSTTGQLARPAHELRNALDDANCRNRQVRFYAKARFRNSHCRSVLESLPVALGGGFFLRPLPLSHESRCPADFAPGTCELCELGCECCAPFHRLHSPTTQSFGAASRSLSATPSHVYRLFFPSRLTKFATRFERAYCVPGFTPRSAQSSHHVL